MMRQSILLSILLAVTVDSFSMHPLARQGRVTTTTTTTTTTTSLQAQQQNENKSNDILESLRKSFVTSAAAAILGFSTASALVSLPPTAIVQPAFADSGARIVGQLKGSGLIFKDTLQIEAFDDPKVKGVKLYISTFQIPVTEKLSGKNLFSDPSYASVACARTGGPVAIADNIAKGLNGEEVFEEKKSLLFKDLRVYRVYDEKANTVVYVSFNTRLDKNDDSNKSRFKSSLCALNLDDLGSSPTSIASAALTEEPSIEIPTTNP